MEAVAGGRDAVALAKTARSLKARFAAVADPDALGALRDALAGSGIEAGAGESAVLEAASPASRPRRCSDRRDRGHAVRPTSPLQQGRTVALANKESLVCAGDAFMRDARRWGTRLLPMDSEHNAIFQAMGAHTADDIETMVLTASGGPFRTWSAAEIARRHAAAGARAPQLVDGREDHDRQRFADEQGAGTH